MRLPHGFQRHSSISELDPRSEVAASEWNAQQAFQRSLLARGEGFYGGWCALCRSPTQFALERAQDSEPNWRESLGCVHCGLINRWRAAIHLYMILTNDATDGSIYLTEQTTPLYRWLATRNEGLIGSEFLGPDMPSGTECDHHGTTLRHEDVTRLSIATETLRAVLTFDVLEHVPNYQAALVEFARVLVPDGLLVLSAPFDIQREETVIRARYAADGTIEHLLAPQYHGDPLREEGVLCFQDFGWSLLDELLAIGFQRAELITCWAPDFGYLGNLQPFVVAWR